MARARRQTASAEHRNGGSTAHRSRATSVLAAETAAWLSTSCWGGPSVRYSIWHMEAVTAC